MCGIAGVFGPYMGRDNALPLLKRMTDHIIHRGPDGEGHWLDPHAQIGLGHRRLSIIDLSDAGAQPMSSHSGRYCISFNGEIYNFAEMRAGLENIPWNGGSDTEVLLALFERFSVADVLDKIDGMFALALWDKKEQNLTLARDRFGEKPLYVGKVGSSFAFASQISAFRGLPDFEPEIDQGALEEFFTYSYIPAPKTIFQKIIKLPAGSHLTFHPETLESGQLPEPQRYWNPVSKHMAHRGRFGGTYADALAKVRDLLDVSVSRRLMADVPLGALLSGGIDSTVTTALAQAKTSHPIQTFTIGMDMPGFNEAPMAAKVAAHLGTDHTTLTLSTQQVVDTVPKMGEIYDEPFSDLSQVPTFLISKLARQKVTVGLTGDGADEIFGGYNRYLYGPRLWSRLQRVPVPLRKSLASLLGLIPAGATDTVMGKLGPKELRAGRASEKVDKFLRLMRTDNFDGLHSALLRTSSDLSGLFQSGGVVAQDLALTPEITGLSHLDRLMLNDVWNYLDGDILAKVDRASMAASLETRTPYLEPGLFNFMQSVPPDFKIRNGVTKRLLRDVAYQFVPKELLDRPKAGFTMPVGRWLRGNLRDWAESHLTADALNNSGLSPDFVHKRWTAHLSGHSNEETFLWSVLMYQSWRAKL